MSLFHERSRTASVCPSEEELWNNSSIITVKTATFEDHCHGANWLGNELVFLFP